MAAGSIIFRPWTWLVAHVAASCILMLGYLVFMAELPAIQEMARNIAASPILSFMMVFTAAGRLAQGNLQPHGAPAWIVGGYLGALLLAVLVQRALAGPPRARHLAPEPGNPPA